MNNTMDLEAMPLDELCKLAQSDFDATAMAVMNDRLKVVSKSYRIRPVIRWEVMEHVVKDHGNFEYEQGWGVHASLGVAYPLALGLIQRDKDKADAENIEIGAPDIEALKEVMFRLERAADLEGVALYGDGPTILNIKHLPG